MTSLLPDAPVTVSVSPLVRRVPAAVDSEGHDCCALSAGYGLTPFAWQRAALIDAMGVRRDGRWAASRVGWSVPRQNGKNGGAEMFELHVMVMLGMRVLHSAHEVKTARKAFKRLLDFFDNPRQYPELAGLVKEIRRTNGQEAIELHNGGLVEFVARTKSSGRGYSSDVLLMDEAQELTDDELEAMMPTISASQNPLVFLMGTPPRPEKAAVVWRRFRASAVDAADPGLCWLEYGVSQDADFASRESWAAANPGAPESIGWDTIAGEFAALSLEGFAAERLGVWFDRTASTALLDVDRWLSLADPSAERGRPVFGLDVDPDRRARVGVAWSRPDGSVQVMLSPDHIDLPAHEAVGVCKALTERWGGKVWLGGAAAGLAADFEREHVPHELLKSGQFPAACGMLLDRLEAGMVRHGNQPELNSSVAGAARRVRGTSGEWEFDLSRSTNVGPLAAVTRALYGLSKGGSVYEERGALVF